MIVLQPITLHLGLFIIWRKKRIVKSFPTDETNGAYQIDFNELRVEAKIGSGSFGDVYKGTWRDTPVAVKRLRHVSFNSMIASVT